MSRLRREKLLNESAQPPSPKRIWSRRWVRRVTYCLAAGVVMAGLVAWAVQRPQVDRWLVARIDQVVRRETGLGFQAESLEVHPFQGRLIFHRPALGGDLFQAESLEVDVEPYSLFQVPHIRRILLASPRLQVDAGRLAALKLREHPESKKPARFRIDRVEVRDGSARIEQPAWGIPLATCTFTVEGWGRGENQLWLEARVPRLALGEGRDRMLGDVAIKCRATEQAIDYAHVSARLGDSAASLDGAFHFHYMELQAEGRGDLNLAELPRLRPGASGPSPAAGFLAFKGKVQGPALAPTWSLILDGRQLQARGAPFHPGTLHAAAAGSPGKLRLEKLAWDSQDGKLEASGNWSRAIGTTLELSADRVSLVPAGVYARTDLLQGLTGRFHGTAAIPTPPWAVPDLQKIDLRGSGQFLKDGQKVGTVELGAADGRVRATELSLAVEGTEFHGSASAQLHKQGLAALEAEGDVATDAAEVAQVLKAWKVTDLDMSGATRARGTMSWSPRDGIQVDGHGQVEDPRWHGAHADRIAADVAIRGDVLTLTGIELEKGPGRGEGKIWLTWADGPPDAEQIDMCFTAFRLPVHEGLAAADEQDLDIQGTGSGWVRLHGPYLRILMEGQAVAEAGRVYGIAIPAASANFAMDIARLRIQADQVRIADSLDHLEGGPGPLDLTGAMDMDADHGRWTAQLSGTADSRILDLPGPALRGQVAARIDGPLTAPLGPYQAPEGTFSLSQGLLALPGLDLKGIEARLSFKDGRLQAQAGLAGKPSPVLEVNALQTAPGRLAGSVRAQLAPATADNTQLTSQLSQGFLKGLDLDFQGQGTWTRGGLAWKGQLAHFQSDFEGFQLGQTLPGTFSGDLTGCNLAMDLEGRTLTAQGGASPESATMSLSGWLPFNPDGKLDLALAGAAELANLKAILDHIVDPGQYSLMADMRPAGSATFNLNLTGQPSNPFLAGRLDLRGGRVSERTYPQSIENVDFTAWFNGRDITIPQDAPLRGTLAQGALAAWGRLTWGGQGLSSYDLSATLDDFQFRDLPEGFEIQGGFNGSLRGNDREGGLLKGTIKAKNMLYEADINLNDVILAGAFGGGLATRDPSDPLARIELDLDMQLARPWEIDTNLLKLQGRPTGAFKIMGSLAYPGLKGRMELLPGGRLTNLLPAGDVILERGSVEFIDPAAFNPVVDLQGTVEVDPYLVTLGITGTLDQINARPSSTPALRPDEIFAILMDPSAVSKVGSTQGAPTQTAVNTGIFNQGAGLLTSLALADGLDRLRKTLGLDRVNFAYASGPNLTIEKRFDILGHKTPVIYNYKQEGTQTTISGNVAFRFGNFVIQLGAKQVTGATQTPGDVTVQGVQPSGEIRHTWIPK